MVDGVDHRFFNGADREIPGSLGLRLVGILDHGFFQVVTFDVADRLAENDGQRPAKLFLLELIAARPIGKPDHINLGGRKKPVWPLVEEQQTYVLGKHRLGGAADDIQALAQVLNGQALCFRCQFAADAT